MVKPFKLVCRKKNQQRRLEHRLRNSFRQILMRTRRIKTVNFLMAKSQSRTTSMYLRPCTKSLYYFLGCPILLFWNHAELFWYFPFGLLSILQISGMLRRVYISLWIYIMHIKLNIIPNVTFYLMIQILENTLFSFLIPHTLAKKQPNHGSGYDRYYQHRSWINHMPN